MSEHTYAKCNWYDLSIKHKKIFLILLIQSQKIIQINICGVVKLNYSTFGNVNIFCCN